MTNTYDPMYGKPRNTVGRVITFLLMLVALMLMGYLLSGTTAFAQTTTPPAAVTVSITDQGADVISQVTGRAPKAATLLDVIACNETNEDQNVSVARLYRQVNTSSAQGVTLYASDVVSQILAVFQDRDVYAKLFKAGTAASTVAAILTTAFKSAPLLSTALQVAPPIFQAVLPVVHSPRDLQDLSRLILDESNTLVLPRYGCHSGVAVARTAAPTIRTEVIKVQ